MTLAVSIAQSGANNVTMRNRIINGNMVIDQRNAGALVSNANGYITDRWTMAKYSSGSGAYSGQQVTDAPAGFTNSLKVTVTTNESSQPTDAYWQVFQRGEGYNFADLGFGTSSPSAITVSFWVKSSVTGTYSACIFNDGSGGTNRAYVTTYTINAANTWEYKSFTLTGDGASGAGYWNTTNGTSVCLFFDMGSGVNQQAASANTWLSTNVRRISGTVRLMATSGATWQVTGVQLEAGTTATAFEQRLYGQELALCQRYYYRSDDSQSNGILMSGGVEGSTGAAVGSILPVTMRATPTITLGSGARLYTFASAAITTTINTQRSSKTNAGLYLNGSGMTGGQAAYLFNAPNASSYFEASAEL
jgi:hypothetical protein